MTNSRARLRSFAVRGVFWRKCLDWAISNVPFYFHPLMIFFWTIFFFIFSASVRRAVVHNLGIVLPESARVMNYLRAFRTFYNFAWTMADTAAYKLLKTPFSYELVGENFLDELAAANGAIILTAHMGSYDLGAALFAEKFAREIRMVRAPEPDELSAKHVDLSLEKAAAGGVKVDYSGAGAMLSLDLLNALRNGQIVSIQGDRVLGNVASSPVPLFGKEVFLPTGPFILALTTVAPIYPLFIVRSGYRTYKVIVQESIVCARTGQPREDDLGIVMQRWSEVLERVISRHWEQWYAFAPIF